MLLYNILAVPRVEKASDYEREVISDWEGGLEMPTLIEDSSRGIKMTSPLASLEVIHISEIPDLRAL